MKIKKTGLKEIKNFHLFMDKKKIKLLKRIAKKQKKSLSKTIRGILSIMHTNLLNKEFAQSPRLSKRKIKIKNKTELRIFIFKEDYDFFAELVYILNYPSIAEVIRNTIDEYLREVSFDGEKEYKRKIHDFTKKYQNKRNILIKNHSFIHKNIYANCFKSRINIYISENNQVGDIMLM